MKIRLRFTLCSDQLLVDTNEDGFTAANVKAVCSINESSKKLSSEDESIGEKGIGFKPVFNIAKSVHIQSGLWSFRFDNDRKDPLSLFVPIPVAPKKLPDQIGTRIALHFQNGKAGEVVDALQALPSNAIAFLRRIKKLEVIVGDPQRGLILADSRELTKGYDLSRRIVTLRSKTKLGEEDGIKTTENHYKLFQGKYSDLPQDDRRQRTSAEVQLAFPVDSQGQAPLVTGEGEDVFAFLPMSRQRAIPVRII